MPVTLVRRNSLVICPPINDGIQEAPMLSRKTKYFSAAAIAAALIATVAIARTVHNGAAVAGAQPAHRSVIGAAPGYVASSPRRGILACGAMSYSDCDRLEMQLPM